MNYDPASYESRRLLNLEEIPSHESSLNPEGRNSVVPLARHTPDPPQSPPVDMAVSLPRAKSEVSLYTPMRRKSLLTPGLATRTPTPVAPLPPKPKPRTRHSLPATPARQGSLEPINAAAAAPFTPPLLVDDPASIPRALTPSDLDYKQTGAFKLGTLRITNGSPVRSPAVGHADEEEEKVQGSPEKLGRTQSDYFGAQGPANHLHVQSVGFSYTTQHALEFEERINIPSSPVSLASRRNTDIPTIQLRPAGEPQGAQSPASNYLAGGASSPRSQPQREPSPRSPQLQVTSKHTAMEDELFEAEADMSSEFPSAAVEVEVLDVRVDLSAKSLSSHPSMSSKRSNSTGVSRADSGIGAASPSPGSVVEKPATAAPRPLAKADSGYSSNVSLRSFSSRRRNRDRDARRSGEAARPKTPPDWPPMLSESARPARTPSDRSRDGPASSVPVVEKEYCQSPDDISNSQSSRRNLRLLSSLTRRSRSSVAEGNNARHGEDKTGPPQQSPATATPAPVSTLSIDIATKQKRIQRLLSGARGSFGVRTAPTHPSSAATVALSGQTATATTSSGIPPVPRDAQSKLRSRRSGSLPKLMRTDMLKTERSRDTLGTIFSVGSAEGAVDGVVAPPPASQSRSGHGEEAPVGVAYERGLSSSVAAALTGGPALSSSVQESSTARSAIPRKPVAQRAKSFEVRQDARVEASHPAGQNGHVDPASRHQRDRSIPAVPDRTSGTAAGRKTARNTASYDSGFPRMADAPATTKSPPPVSMQNRSSRGYAPSRPEPASSGSPHVARSNSQPTTGTHHQQEVRDGFYGSAAAAATSHSTSSLAAASRRSSRENFAGSHPYTQQPQQSPTYRDPAMKAATASAYQPADPTPAAALSNRNTPGRERTAHRVPRWDVQTDHDTSRSRQSSVGRESNRSYAVGNGGSAETSKANSIQDHPPHPHAHSHSQPDAHPSAPQQRPPFHHRSNYESRAALRPRQSWDGEIGYAYHASTTTTQMNGQIYVGDPRRGRRASQHQYHLHHHQQQQQQQQQQQARAEPAHQNYGKNVLNYNNHPANPPYAAPPRGQVRNRSVGSAGSGPWSCDRDGNPLPPFRVLHSYNSPAYRNVPIWG